MFGKNCPPKISEEGPLPRKQETSLPKTSLKQSPYPKFPEEEVSTKKSLKRHSLSLYQKMSQEKSLPKYMFKKNMKRQKRHSLPFFWRDISTKRNCIREMPTKKIDEKWLPKNKRHLCEEVSREISTKKNLSRDTFPPKEFYETYLPTNLWRIIFNKQTLEERFIPNKSLRRHPPKIFSRESFTNIFSRNTLYFSTKTVSGGTSLPKKYLKKNLYLKKIKTKRNFYPKNVWRGISNQNITPKNQEKCLPKKLF